jgi:hypothetical protein
MCQTLTLQLGEETLLLYQLGPNKPTGAQLGNPKIEYTSIGLLVQKSLDGSTIIRTSQAPSQPEADKKVIDLFRTLLNS